MQNIMSPMSGGKFIPWGCIIILIIFSLFTGFSIANIYITYNGNSNTLYTDAAYALLGTTIIIFDIFVIQRWDKYLDSRYRKRLNYHMSFSSRAKKYEGYDEYCNNTISHIDNVIRYMRYIINQLSDRADSHDESMLLEPELSAFKKAGNNPAPYGSKAYMDNLSNLNILKHHYMVNRHHPEHFKNGILDMNLIDIIEMLCDWKSVPTKSDSGDLFNSIEINQSRFKYQDDLKAILMNTAELLYKYSIRYHSSRTNYDKLYAADTLEKIYYQIENDENTTDIEKYYIKYGPKDEFLSHPYRCIRTYSYKAEYVYTVNEFKLGVQ